MAAGPLSTRLSSLLIIQCSKPMASCSGGLYRLPHRALNTTSTAYRQGDEGTSPPPISVIRKRAQQRIASIDSTSPWKNHDIQRHPETTSLFDSSHAKVTPSLLDSFGRDHTYLRISLTERCSFRCTYCMPTHGVPLSPDSRLLTSDEIKRIASVFVGMGVNKIRLTGGEPTLRPDLIDIVRHLDALKASGLESIGITTNGLVLNRILEPLVDAGLTHLNVSIDSLRSDRFAKITRMPEGTSAKVMRSIHQALALRRRQLSSDWKQALRVKLNVVVMKGMNEDEVKEFVDFTREQDVDVRFIEYMPFNSNSWSTSLLVPASDLMQNIRSFYPGGSILKEIDEGNDTTRHWSLQGHKGRFGFISSMTDHFCSSCNRIRLLADGNLKVCLFSNKEVSLRDALRNGRHDDIAMKTLISQALSRKHFKHAGLGEPKEIWEAAEGKVVGQDLGREMSKIGG